MIWKLVVYPIMNIRFRLHMLMDMGYLPDPKMISSLLADSLVPSLPDWVDHPVKWIMGILIDMIQAIFDPIINFMIWCFTFTPAPNAGATSKVSPPENDSVSGTNSSFMNGSVGTTSKKSIFATPPSNAPWGEFYKWEQNMASIGIILLLTFWIISFALTGLTTFLRKHDQSHVNRRVLLGVTGIYGWWYIHAAATNLANTLALTIAPNASDFTESFTSSLLTTGSASLLVLALSGVSFAIIGATILLYVVRIMVIFIYSFAMPLLIAMWAVDVGIFSPISDIGRKFMNYYAPAVFFTLPAALLLRASSIFFNAPMKGLGGIGLSLFAMAIPVLAVVVPKMMFSEIAGMAPSKHSVNKKLPGVGHEADGKPSSHNDDAQQRQEFRDNQSPNANRSVGGSSSPSPSASSSPSSSSSGNNQPSRSQDFSVRRAKRRAAHAKNAAMSPVNARRGETKTQQKFGTPRPDYDTGGYAGHSISESASRMVSGKPSMAVGQGAENTNKPGNMREVMDRVESDQAHNFDWDNAQFSEQSIQGRKPEEVAVHHVSDQDTAQRMSSENPGNGVYIPDMNDQNGN